MHTTFKIFNDYRLKKGWSVTHFAKMIDLPQSVVSRALKGITTPHDYNRMKFEKFFNEHKDDIYTTLMGMNNENTTAVLQDLPK